MGSVYQRVFSLCREAAREELRRTYGEQLEKWVHRANASVTDVAAALGWKRANLYKVFRGRLPLHAEDLYLLPPEVLRIVADLAATIGLELRPAAELGADHDDDRAALAVVHEALDTIRHITTMRADGKIDRREAIEGLREIEELEAALAPLRTRLRQVVAEGAKVLEMRSRGGEG